MAFEDSYNGILRPWQCRGSTVTKYPVIGRRQVPRQENGDDCGVYVCVFADLLETSQRIDEVNQHKIPTARDQCIRTL